MQHHQGRLLQLGLTSSFRPPALQLAGAVLLAALATPAWAGGEGGAAFGDSSIPGNPGNMVTGEGGKGLGAAGGFGGRVGYAPSTTTTSLVIASSAPLTGENGGTGSAGNGAGGGGDALAAPQATVRNEAVLTGGKGGDVSGGGGGGGGGAGLVAGRDVQNAGTILGGAGGTISDAGGTGGSGGGGAGVVASGIVLVNEAGRTIQGGNGGANASVTFVNGNGQGGDGSGGALGGTFADPGGGHGGSGVIGGNLTVINQGSIAGGRFVFRGGNPTETANAVTFLAGNNRMELRPGFSFTGEVKGDGDDVLALRADAGDDGTISLPTLVAPAFQGFTTLEKVGAARWTVTGTQAHTWPWTLREGSLNLSSAKLPAVTLAGGTLMGNGSVDTLNGGPGQVSPGNPMGQLRLLNASTLAGSTYVAEIDPGANAADLLQVNGVNLNGANLTITSLTGEPTVGQAYTVMSGTGISGQFAKVVLSNDYPLLAPKVSYSATSVTVSFVAVPAALTLNPVANVSQGQAPQLAGSMTPAINGTVQVQLTDANGQVQTLTAPMTNGSWTLAGPSNLALGPVTVQVSVPALPTVTPVSGQFTVTAATVNASMTLNPVANVYQGQAPQLSGSSTPPINGTVQVQLTDASGQVQTLTAPMANGSWTLAGPSNLAVGPVTVQVSVPGQPGVQPVSGQFTVNAATVVMNPVADVKPGEAPQLSGSSLPAMNGTVEAVFTDSATKSVQTVQAPLQNGVWSLTGPSNLAAGPVTVTVSVQGNPAVTPAKAQFMVGSAAGVTPVPVDAGWALGAIGALLAWLGVRRRTRSQG